MIERLRTLSPLLRFVVYVVGALLLFFLAVGVGVLGEFVLSRQFGAAPNFPVGGSAPGSTTPMTIAREPENTATKPSGDSNSSKGTAQEVSFVHRATDGNSRGDYTYISDPRIDGKPDAVVLVSPTSDRASGGAAAYGHNIGVWYEGRAGRWAIFNQDLAAVPAGATFEVVVPKASTRGSYTTPNARTPRNTTPTWTTGEPTVNPTPYSRLRRIGIPAGAGASTTTTR